MDLFSFDESFYNKKVSLIAGIDEAGRGSIAGPVVAAGVIFPKGFKIPYLNDSKQLSIQRREKLFAIIKKKSLAYSIKAVDNKTIDKINILQATFLAMYGAVSGLPIQPNLCLIDGNYIIPNFSLNQVAIVKGDAKSASIAAASILAKVARDNIMIKYARKYSVYKFEKHKGYATKWHIESLKMCGVCPIHRLTFAPVKNVVSQIKFGI
ncbi:MAG: ribonuclease HII [Endomicrobium sp.]|jgi:ribonuclease HII|nr:ribonuclease HII [Endomicrobium sp.]